MFSMLYSEQKYLNKNRNIKHPTFSETALNMNHLLRSNVQLCLSANEALHSLLTAGRVMGLAVVFQGLHLQAQRFS